MRREHHDIREGRQVTSNIPAARTAADEPRKRSYERIVDGEKIFPDELVDEALPMEPVEPESFNRAIDPAAPAPTAVEVDREIDQELAWQSGSSPAKYGSLGRSNSPADPDAR